MSEPSGTDARLDRIEELVKERDGYLAERNKFQFYLQRTYADWVLEVVAVEALNAKLTKAVEALEDLVRDCEADYPPSHGAIKHFAIATLAEIKGESHD